MCPKLSFQEGLESKFGPLLRDKQAPTRKCSKVARWSKVLQVSAKPSQASGCGRGGFPKPHGRGAFANWKQESRRGEGA